MPKTFADMKKFYLDHERKFMYSALGASLLTIIAYRAGIKDHNNFLKAHSLYEKYYTLEDE